MDNKVSSGVEVGYSYLVKHYQLAVIPHYRASYIGPQGIRGIKLVVAQEMVSYAQSYALSDPDDPLQQLEFALRYDGMNLEIIVACFKHISPQQVTTFIAAKPTGKYRRMIWFLYEFLTETQLSLPDCKSVPYVDLLDAGKYYVGQPRKSKRHAINNNLLGNREFCPIVRKTDLLKAYEDKQLSDAAKNVMSAVDVTVLARAINYLYTKETKSSFAIEKVKPDVQRETKFIALLESAASLSQLDKALLLDLQNAIVDDAYQDADYRDTQNYVGELTPLYTQKVHYISPKPDDLKNLMRHFLLCETELFETELSPVIIAAILAFGFVFLHPFEDGNGRIHRFIIHYVLSKTGFTPDNVIFPVSAVMLKNRREYDEVLEFFSRPLLQVIGEYELNDDGELRVLHETKQHYQYIDYTVFAEYLFSCIEQTIEEDFKEELNFIVKYDKTKAEISQIIDIPDLKLDRIIRCISQNNGVLGAKMRRTYFSELSDDVIQAIETVVQKHMLE